MLVPLALTETQLLTVMSIVRKRQRRREFRDNAPIRSHNLTVGDLQWKQAFAVFNSMPAPNR
jgi:hypothetical protein